MITYLEKFITNFAEVNFTLRTMLKKEIEFKFRKPHLDATGKLKLLIETIPCLKMFNPSLQSHLKTDASSEGLGALLEQNHGTLTYPKWYPTGYAS